MPKTDRTPKKIAGLKLPKSIRQAPAIKALLATPAGRKLLGDALMEGAAFAAAKVMEAHAAGQAALPAKPVKTVSRPRKPAVAKADAPAATEAAAVSETPAADKAPAAEPVVPPSAPPKPVAPAAIAAAPPKPPAAAPEPFKNDVPVTAKPPVRLLDDKADVDAPPTKSDAAG